MPVLKRLTSKQSHQNNKPIPCSDAYITLHVNISQQLGINDVKKLEKPIADQLHEYRYRKNEAYHLMQKSELKYIGNPRSKQRLLIKEKWLRLLIFERQSRESCNGLLNRRHFIKRYQRTKLSKAVGKKIYWIYLRRQNWRYHVVYQQIHGPAKPKFKLERIVINAGGNHILNGYVSKTTRKLQSMLTQVKQIFTTTKIFPSSIMARQDEVRFGVPVVNQELRNICSKMRIGYICDADITHRNLDDFGAYINTRRTKLFGFNLIQNLRIYGGLCRILE